MQIQSEITKLQTDLANTDKTIIDVLKDIRPSIKKKKAKKRSKKDKSKNNKK